MIDTIEELCLRYNTEPSIVFGCAIAIGVFLSFALVCFILYKVLYFLIIKLYNFYKNKKK